MDHSLAYTAQMRVNRDGETVYQESQTSDRQRVVQAWIKRRQPSWRNVMASSTQLFYFNLGIGAFRTHLQAPVVSLWVGRRSVRLSADAREGLLLFLLLHLLIDFFVYFGTNLIDAETRGSLTWWVFDKGFQEGGCFLGALEY